MVSTFIGSEIALMLNEIIYKKVETGSLVTVETIKQEIEEDRLDHNNGA